MTKKPAPKKIAKPKSMSADEHRKMASKHDAMASIHSAKARLMDAMNPPPKNKRNMPY